MVTVFGLGKKKGDKAKAKAKPKKEKKPKAKKEKKPARKAPSVPVKKRPTDIYTVMLMLSLGFVALACLFLGMELSAYDFPSNMTPWKP